MILRVNICLPFLGKFLFFGWMIFGCFGRMQAQSTKPLTSYVNPFTGTDGHGHTYPGATLPFGFVQLSPDTDDTGWDWCSGYHYRDSTIMGFSHTHLSGTGISDLADILVVPGVGRMHLQPGDKTERQSGYRSAFSHDDEVAMPGYYAVTLKKHPIRAEMTATLEMGVHRYTFPATDSAWILVDLLHGLDRHRSWLTEHVLESALQVVDSVTVAGYRISSGWANVQPVWFQMRFSKPFTRVGMALHDVYRPDCTMMRGRNVKGVFHFSAKELEKMEVVVQLSVTPFEKPMGKVSLFDQARHEAEKLWEETLSAIRIEAPDSIRRTFYTAMYHAALAPNMLAGASSDSIGNHAKTEYGTLSQWDTYRAAFALNTLIRPDVTEGIIRTLLSSAKKNGYLPVWKLWQDDVHCMIGTPSVPILVEAVEKGYGLSRLTEIRDAIVATMEADNPVAPWSVFDKFGYVPADVGELFSVSKTLEMAYASSCAAEFLEKHFPDNVAKIAKYRTRARAYKNVFDVESGFFRGKTKAGQWVTPFDPAVTDETSFVEATPWQYLFHVQHDVAGLMALMGGKEEMHRRLDDLFRAKEGRVDGHILDITGLIGQYAHGNEPSHHVAYLYNYVDHPSATQERVTDICTRFYSARPDGLCGNEDCGQMSAWYIFSALGLYPVHPASGNYDLGIPLVDKAECRMHGGKILTIKTQSPGKSSKGKADDSRGKYIREVRFNGLRLNSPIVKHSQLVMGGTLEFFLSDTPVNDAFSRMKE